MSIWINLAVTPTQIEERSGLEYIIFLNRSTIFAFKILLGIDVFTCVCCVVFLLLMRVW